MRNSHSACLKKTVKQSLSQSPEGARRPAATVFYLYSPEVAMYHFANATSAEYHRFSLPPSHLAPSFRVTLFEFMEKLYGS